MWWWRSWLWCWGFLWWWWWLCRLRWCCNDGGGSDYGAGGSGDHDVDVDCDGCGIVVMLMLIDGGGSGDGGRRDDVGDGCVMGDDLLREGATYISWCFRSPFPRQCWRSIRLGGRRTRSRSASSRRASEIRARRYAEPSWPPDNTHGNVNSMPPSVALGQQDTAQIHSPTLRSISILSRRLLYKMTNARQFW